MCNLPTVADLCFFGTLMIMTIDVSALEQLHTCALQIKEALPVFADRATVLILTGDVGAGKTTFMQILGGLYGIAEPMTSPTYTLLQSYALNDSQFTSLVHMDAYRLQTIEELGPLHFSELLKQPHTLLCIEWGEKIQEAIPTNDVQLSLALSETGVRTGTISLT